MKVVVITGTSDGTSAKATHHCAGRDRTDLALVLAARGEDRLQAVATKCRSLSATALVQRRDVSRQADCISLLEAAAAAFGSIAVLANNAALSAHARFDEARDLLGTRR